MKTLNQFPHLTDREMDRARKLSADGRILTVSRLVKLYPDNRAEWSEHAVSVSVQVGDCGSVRFNFRHTSLVQAAQAAAIALAGGESEQQK